MQDLQVRSGRLLDTPTWHWRFKTKETEDNYQWTYWVNVFTVNHIYMSKLWSIRVHIYYIWSIRKGEGEGLGWAFFMQNRCMFNQVFWAVFIRATSGGSSAEWAYHKHHISCTNCTGCIFGYNNLTTWLSLTVDNKKNLDRDTLIKNNLCDFFTDVCAFAFKVVKNANMTENEWEKMQILILISNPL